MRVCPKCRARYDDAVRVCVNDRCRPLPESVITAAGGDALLGTTVAQRYTIVGKLGSGAMGTVYRAEQAPIGREIALKLLRKDLGRDPETVARFHREAQTLSHLKHPNTVTIFDFGQTEDGLLFLAMELLEGEMLSSRIKRVGPLDVPLAIRTASGALRSLAEAHAQGIIHRDLKPDNIFLARVHGRPEEDEVVKVVDFGIAKIREGERGLEPLQTAEGTVFGTPRYMSPEQAQGKSLDGRSDLYAIGVLLFHMLTGRPPFTDDDAVIVMAHHIKSIPEPVRTLAPTRPIPAKLEALVAMALEKDPAKRPQTAEEFLELLEATLDSARQLVAAQLAPASDVDAPPPPAPSRARGWLMTVALLMLVGVGGALIVVPRLRGARGGSSGTESALATATAASQRPGAASTGATANPTGQGNSAERGTAMADANAPVANAASSDAGAVGPTAGGAGALTALATDAGTGVALSADARATIAGATAADANPPPVAAAERSSRRHGARHRGQRNASTGTQPYRRWTD